MNPFVDNALGRVVVISKYSSPSVGGGERQLEYFIREMKKSHHVIIHTAQANASLNGHTNTKIIVYQDTSLLETYRKILPAVSRELRSEDIVYLIAYQKDAVQEQTSIILKCAEAKARTVVRFSSEGEATEFFAKIEIRAEFIASIDRVVSLSPGMSRELAHLGFPESKIMPFLNPVDVKFFQNHNPPRAVNKRARFLVLSRPHQKKRWIYIIEEFERAMVGGGILNFIGASNDAEYLDLYFDECKRVVYSKNLQRRIRMLKGVGLEKVPAMLGRYQYFISASYNEGMQNSLLEALACGVRVIAPNTESFDFLPKVGAIRYEFEAGGLAKAIRSACDLGPLSSAEVASIRRHLERLHPIENYRHLCEIT